MAIVGAEGMTAADMQREIAQGAKIVVFPYTISLLVVTLRRSSDPVLVRRGQPTFKLALPYLALSFFLGWWGFPFGLIFTPIAMIECLGGGKDVTGRVLQALGGVAPSPNPGWQQPGWQQPGWQQQQAWQQQQQQQRAWQQQQAWGQQQAPQQQGGGPRGWEPMEPPRDKP